MVEELVKCAPLVVAVYRKRSAFFAEVLIYGAAVGAGFALLENILYVSFNADFTVLESLVRGFGTALLHIGCTALCATMVLMFSRRSMHSKLWVKFALSMASLIPSCAIHYVYNLFLLPPFIQMILTVVVIISLFFVIYAVDEKLIHRWLDMCISNDIALYSSMKQGQLHATRAGQYLVDARERFQPEVFFDICVYLGLYLEVSIAAKSRMIMKEAGLDISSDGREHEEYQAKLTELKALRKSIGTAGVLLLNPIVDMKSVDEWVMSELL